LSARLFVSGVTALGISLVVFGATAVAETHAIGIWEDVASYEAAGYSADGLAAVTALAEAGNTQSMMVIVGGRVLYRYGDLTEISYIASVRKSVLAMLYGPAVGDGRIDISRTVADLGIDDIGGLTEQEKTATIEDIISARSGVYHLPSNGSGNTIDIPPRDAHVPGTFFYYNNWDFNVAGYIYETLSGNNIYDAMSAQIAVPIGMQDFDLEAQRDGRGGNLEQSLFPAYHMYFSTRDLARIGQLMLNKGRWGEDELFDAEWLNEITSFHTVQEDMYLDDDNDGEFGYGYMWWVMDQANNPPEYKGAYAGRGHFGQYLIVVPELDMVISHKTSPQSYETPEEYEAVRVTWGQMKALSDAVLAARSGE